MAAQRTFRELRDDRYILEGGNTTLTIFPPLQIPILQQRLDQSGQDMRIAISEYPTLNAHLDGVGKQLFRLEFFLDRRTRLPEYERGP
jgi:hypothetical protein